MKLTPGDIIDRIILTNFTKTLKFTHYHLKAALGVKNEWWTKKQVFFCMFGKKVCRNKIKFQFGKK